MPPIGGIVRTCGRLATVGAAVVLCGVLPEAQQGRIDAKTRAALEEMRAAYTSLKAFHIKVNWTAQYSGGMSADDFPLPGPDVLELRMERPNRLFMSAATKRAGRTLSYLVVSDGTSLWYWRGGTTTYTQVAAPATFAGIAAVLPRDAIGMRDGNTWEADTIMEWDFLTTGLDPATEFSPPGATVTLATAKLGVAPVAVLQIRSSAPMTLESDIYLDLESHLIRGTALTARGKHPETGRDFSVAMRSVYEVHDSRPQFGADAFRFAPPSGATRASGR